MKRISLRKLLPWLVVAAVAAFAVYRLKFSPVPVPAHIIVTGEVRGEVMGIHGCSASHWSTCSPLQIYLARSITAATGARFFPPVWR